MLRHWGWLHVLVFLLRLQTRTSTPTLFFSPASFSMSALTTGFLAYISVLADPLAAHELLVDALKADALVADALVANALVDNGLAANALAANGLAAKALASSVACPAVSALTSTPTVSFSPASILMFTWSASSLLASSASARSLSFSISTLFCRAWPRVHSWWCDSQHFCTHWPPMYWWPTHWWPT